MPNLAGTYLFQTGSTDLKGVLGQMARIIDIPCVGYRMLTALSRHAACVNLVRPLATNSSQLARDNTKDLWLMLDGELYNTDELRRWLSHHGRDAEGLDDAGLVLSLFLAEGEDFVGRLIGQFNVVVYRESDRSLLLANDRYGYRPLFVAEYPSQLLFATEMKAIIAASDSPPTPDGIGLLQIFREGIALGDRTWLAPIRVLDPGTILRATPDGVRRTRHFRFRFREEGARMSLSAFVEGFRVKLHRAADRIMKGGRGRIGISLSGGLDSRSVLLSIDPVHLPIPAYTFGYPQSRDVMYAKQLAALLGLPHFHLAFEPGYLGRVLPAVVWRNEAMFPFASATSPYFHRRIGEHMDIILNGHCGDALTGSHIRPWMMLERSKAKLIERMFRCRQLVDEENLRLVFNPQFYKRYAPHLYDAMRDLFATIDNEDIPNVADAWDMENRQHRGTFHSPSVDRHRFEQRTPFLDNDLVDHLVTAPPRWRFQQRAYKKMIVGTFPNARCVPWAYTGARLSSSPVVDLALGAWNYAHNRASGVLSRIRNGNQLVGQDFRDLRTEVRNDRALIRTIVEFADSPTVPGEVFDAPGIKEIIRQHCDSGNDHTHLLACLATFATAYRLLFFDQHKVVPATVEDSLGLADG
jgi:asparagine synthase (glutamine-hydrolysing)